MAKAVTIKIKLLSTADTGFFYVTKKNSRTMTEKMSKKSTTRSRASTSSSRKPRSSEAWPPIDSL
jgi:ribosomal protein L33